MSDRPDPDGNYVPELNVTYYSPNTVEVLKKVNFGRTIGLMDDGGVHNMYGFRVVHHTLSTDTGKLSEEELVTYYECLPEMMGTVVAAAILTFSNDEQFLTTVMETIDKALNNRPDTE